MVETNLNTPDSNRDIPLSRAFFLNYVPKSAAKLLHLAAAGGLQIYAILDTIIIDHRSAMWTLQGHDFDIVCQAH